MKICKFCETCNSDDENFCVVCGNRLIEHKKSDRVSKIEVTDREIKKSDFGSGKIPSSSVKEHVNTGCLGGVIYLIGLILIFCVVGIILFVH